ncbi:MAG: sigma-54-dependent Fis family transcriptional regulator [Calditrichaeota bacterium]|nr:MAG: sigma-54-dependent Fis family transcriptional regulator [Calditrichota bacterium]
MQHINLITGDRRFADMLSRVLSEDTQCTIHTHDKTGTTTNHHLHDPDVLIVDLFSSQDSSKNNLLLSLRNQYPHAVIVALVDSRGPALDDDLLFGADEIIAHSSDGQWLHEIKEHLLDRIALHRRIQRLQERLRKDLLEAQIVAKSKAMHDILRRLPLLAENLSSVLITGETGTGKELVARAIHYLGPRAGGPFITVDCGALPENLVENELFGHVRGAYTDAGPTTRGLIAEADGGTLFLDEIEALPLSVQAKFLRFLQERQYRPLGQTKYFTADVRILAATNIELKEAVAEQRFRKDLYFRLNVVPLQIPPLRQRKSDIPALIEHFLQKYGGESRKTRQVPLSVLQNWMDYSWPGNVRELENKVQEWLALGGAPVTSPASERAKAVPAPLPPLAEVRQAALRETERAYLQQLLRRTAGNLSAAARLARIDRKNLRNLLKKHGIQASRFRTSGL